MGRSGGSGMLVMDTVTNTAGDFLFVDFQPFATDSMMVVLKALNRRDRAHGIRIELEEQSFPGMGSLQTAPGFTTGHMLIDTSTQRLAKVRSRMLGLANPGSVMLEEAVVTAQARVLGSKNLNPGGGADQVILRDVFVNTPNKTLLDLLYEHVDSFGMQYVEGKGEYIPGAPPRQPGIRSRSQVYTLDQNYARLVIDGTELSQFYYPDGAHLSPPYLPWNPMDATLIEDFDPRGYMEYLRPYLDYFVADDIVGIEIMNNMRYKGRYQTRHLRMNEQFGVPVIGRGGLSFIEITTRLGTGPFLNRIPGEYRYRPVVPVISPEFYSPRYTRIEPEGGSPDTRATLYWNPEVLVDGNGEAQFSFYTSDNPGGYVVVVQGTDLFGGLGVGYRYFNVTD